MSSMRTGVNGDRGARPGLCPGEVSNLGEVKACRCLSETQGGDVTGRRGMILLEMEERPCTGLATQRGFILKVELELRACKPRRWKMASYVDGIKAEEARYMKCSITDVFAIQNMQE